MLPAAAATLARPRRNRLSGLIPDFFPKNLRAGAEQVDRTPRRCDEKIIASRKRKKSAAIRRRKIADGFIKTPGEHGQNAINKIWCSADTDVTRYAL